jgi:signal transduction histidine kinase
MRRLPIRVRVAAGFALAMAIVLSATGVLIYGRVGADLASALDQDLRLRAQDVSALIDGRGASLGAESGPRLIESGESFAQLLTRGRRVLDATRSLGGAPLLTAAEASVVLERGPRFFDRRSVRGLDEPARLLSVPVRRGVLVLGATLENRSEALRSLRTELLIAGPLALLVATGLGYLLAGAGLRAVEAMRRRAAEISADRAGERLPVPPSGDELERLGETLNEMLTRLEAAIERERGFVAEAGHELRTPLALMRAELDYALHYAETEQELRRALSTASQETDRLAQLAADLLLIASTDQGRLALRVETFSARGLLDSVHHRFAWRAESEGRQLELQTPADLTLTADRIRLEQALGNLVDNALRHGAGTVTLAARSGDGLVSLLVRDEGAGFPAEFLPQAFERFSRGDPSHGGAGAGLGLTIVRAIAIAHDGTATASGTEVCIELPRTSRRTELHQGISPAGAGA